MVLRLNQPLILRRHGWRAIVNRMVTRLSPPLTRRSVRWATLVAVIAATSLIGFARPAAPPPNVLFIAVDDLNDWIEPLKPDAPVRTPQMNRLAARGVTFTRAYCVSPECNPSRVSVMTGLRPSTTGVYANASDWRRVLPDAVTLPQHFMAHGYSTAAAGKVFHHTDPRFHDEASFQSWLPFEAEPLPAQRYNNLDAAVMPDGSLRRNAPTFDWGPPVLPEEQMLDVRSVAFGAEFLGRAHDQPFFLAIGIFRPHLPYFVPQRYLDAYPPEEIILPVVNADDLDDIPPGGRMLRARWTHMYDSIAQAGEAKWREAIAAYCASIAFVDDQLGQLLDALENSPHADNTIIVLWSDHGYHLGEKAHWTKFVLWERATRVPLIIAGPGVTAGAHCDRPVSLLDLYPTLAALSDLPIPAAVEGNNLVPLLKDPALDWPQPALMTYGPYNHAVRSERWRYISYADGGEELYDHDNDPQEWHNLAADPQHRAVIAALRQWLPDRPNADPAPDTPGFTSFYQWETTPPAR